MSLNTIKTILSAGLIVVFVSAFLPGFEISMGGITEQTSHRLNNPDSSKKAKLPEDVNPLTGLVIKNPDNLLLPPALVSITNWPASSRPQAGLSFSPLVFELFIGEGMSRFVALFYGDFPTIDTEEHKPEGSGTSNSDNDDSNQVTIGPIRSGRLPYDHLQKSYNGFLVMASGYKGVLQNLSQFTNIYGTEEDDINSAMIPVAAIEDMAKSMRQEVDPESMQVNQFTLEPPSNGLPAPRLWFMYNSIDQVVWQYSQDTGSYNRYQDDADGETFILATDLLNGEPLSYENVVILFTNHRFCTETAFDLDLMYINKSPAILLRDGQLFRIFWTTKNEDYEKSTGKLRPIRFIDENGEPFPLKPGQSWVHFVPLNTPVWEATELSQVGLDGALEGSEWEAPDPARLLHNLINQKTHGSGEWVTRFETSYMVYDESVCQALK